MSKKLETYANIDPLNLLDLIKYFWLYKIFLIIPFFISIIISLVLYLTLDDTYVYEIKLSPVSEDKVRNYISTVEIKIPNKPHGFTADITKQPLPYNYYSSQLITPSGGVLSNGNLFNIYIDKPYISNLMYAIPDYGLYLPDNSKVMGYPAKDLKKFIKDNKWYIKLQ